MIYDGGHGAFPRPESVRETLDWLDKYLVGVRELCRRKFIEFVSEPQRLLVIHLRCRDFGCEAVP